MSFESFRPAPEGEETIDPNELVLEGRDLAQSLGATEKELEAIPNTPVEELIVEAESALSRLELQELQELSRRAQELLIQSGITEADIANLSLQEISDKAARLLADVKE
jgi:hypothetical protein